LSALRSSLTRNIGRRLPELHDEVVSAFGGLEGTEITLIPNMIQIVARTTARVFVGLPLCQNKEYIDLSISQTESVLVRAQIIAMFPNILKPY
ncbi:hypothetical protein B0H13DRAFT_1529855, partial [Mycena leptocephala]